MNENKISCLGELNLFIMGNKFVFSENKIHKISYFKKKKNS